MHLLLIVAALGAVLAIACEERAAGRHQAFYLLKPLTTLLLLGAVLLAPDADADYRRWIAAGLVLSMLGDTALMFAGDRAFIAGLGSFLLAHLLFVWALLGGHLAWPPAWTLLPVAAALAFFFWLLPRTGPLRIPVCVYGLALVAMTLAAALRAQARDDLSGWLAAAGALLFLVSDGALAIRQFGGPYARAQALILATYWLAIGLIASSVGDSAALAR